jgi:glycosyltransferase-like protein
MTKLRIALYTHSTNPRGGVVHSLELANALAQAGHDVTVHAPDPSGNGFFRKTAARQVSIKAAPAAASLRHTVAQRINEIAAHVRSDQTTYDIQHAQDSINANALADCVRSGDIPGFIRTVHHIDQYTDPQLLDWQYRGIHEAGKCFCVSSIWQQLLLREHDIDADIVPNGVSLDCFSPQPGTRDPALRARLQIGNGPVFLAVGGVEDRKNTLNILRGFKYIVAQYRDAQLIIAGGASLLDHSRYKEIFYSELDASGLSHRVIITGPVDDDDMPSLYRIADALVFPSVKEGFGLVVLEALATQTPVVVSRIAPFTEYLTDADCSFADPLDSASISEAMIRAVSIAGRSGAVEGRRRVAARMGWNKSATRHLSLYEALLNRERRYA